MIFRWMNFFFLLIIWLIIIHVNIYWLMVNLSHKTTTLNRLFLFVTLILFWADLVIISCRTSYLCTSIVSTLWLLTAAVPLPCMWLAVPLLDLLLYTPLPLPTLFTTCLLLLFLWTLLTRPVLSVDKSLLVDLIFPSGISLFLSGGFFCCVRSSFRFPDRLPCLQRASISSASWLISPSARKGLSQPSYSGLKIKCAMNKTNSVSQSSVMQSKRT